MLQVLDLTLFETITNCQNETQTAKHSIVVDGVDTLLNVRRGPCEGVKKCIGPECSYIVSNRQKVNQCVHHRDSHPLVTTGPCSAHMVYIWPSFVTSHGKTYTNDFPETGFSHGSLTGCSRLEKSSERVGLHNQMGSQKSHTSGRKFYTASKSFAQVGQFHGLTQTTLKTYSRLDET